MEAKELKVLAIDTATRVCSVALIEGDSVAGENLLYGRKNHSEKLTSLLDDLFNNTEVSPESIDLIAVSSGPGSFTGLRVGISTAQGLAFSLGKDLIGVSTLDVLAYQACTYSGYICPMIDARKQQVYTCLYKCCEGGRLEKAVAEKVIDPEEWLLSIQGHKPTLFLGDGACSYSETIDSVLKGDYMLLPGCSGIPRASMLACIARERYLQNRRNELEEIVPVYIRLPDAEQNARMGKGRFNPQT